MKKNIRISISSLILLLILHGSSHAQFGNLSVDFKRAQDMVSDFRYRGNINYGSTNNKPNNSSNYNSNASTTDIQSSYTNLSDPSNHPYFDNTPTVLPPPSAIQQALTKEINKTKNRISKLRSRKEAFKVALEKLQNAENYNSELEDWAEESQSAQIDALLASIGLLGDEAGPIKEMIETKKFNSVYIFNTLQERNIKLEEINSILKVYNIGEVKDLNSARGLLVTAMLNEVNLKEFFKNLDKFSDYMEKGIKAVEEFHDIYKQHSLSAAIKLTESYAVDLAKDAGLIISEKKLIKNGMSEVAGIAGLANFAIDYGYNCMKFWISWTNIDDLLIKSKENNDCKLTLDIKIIETTDLINSLNKQLKHLQAAEGDDDAGSKVMKELHQQQLYDAYLAGDYYSQRTGIYAPGTPINNKE